MNHLIITLPHELPQATTQLDYLLSADGRTISSHSRTSLALLPRLSNGEVVVVLPIQALSWHQVQLPRGLLSKNFLSDGGSPRLRAVLESLLEDHLLDEPGSLHLSLGPNARDDAPSWVAACDRAWLRAWLQALEASRQPVTRIVPEFAPDEAQGLQDGPVLHVVGSAQQAHIVMTRQTEGSAPREAPLVLPLSHDSVTLAQWPEGSRILAEPAVAALAEEHFKRRVDLQQSTERWLRACQSDWDMAQFDLQNSSRSRSWKRLTGIFGTLLQAPRWRAARWATVALVVTHLIGLNAWAWAERASVDAKRQAIKDVLTTTFPGVKVVVDAPVQMSRELALLRQSAGGTSNSDFDSVLASFGALAPENNRINAIEYAANELRIKGLGLSAAQVTEANEKLKRQGLTVTGEGDSLLIKALAAP